MSIEQVQSDEAKKETIITDGNTAVNISNTAAIAAHNQTEKEHDISSKEADNLLKTVLATDTTNTGGDKRTEKKEKKQEEKFKEDIKEVRAKATSYMGMGDFQQALDAVYPTIKKNKDYVSDNFVVDLNVWKGDLKYIYADGYSFNYKDSSNPAAFNEPSKEVKGYEEGMKKMYQEINNQEGLNKGKDLGTAAYAIYLLSYPTLINKKLASDVK